MSKRSLEDAEVANGKAEARKDGPVKKKSKKSKLVDETPIDSPAESSQGNADEEKETKEARRERKKLKKAKRLADAAGIDIVAVEEEKEDDVEKASARRKAEKAAQKEAKKLSQTRDEEATPSNRLPFEASVDSSYVENSELSSLPQSDIDAFLAKHFISITDPASSKTAYRPITKFTYLPASAATKDDPFRTFTAPTPIQAAAWPHLLAGRDVIGVAETGSGKTMAFAVPCVRSIAALPKKQRFIGAKAVVVSPTRELAVQSFEQITKIAAPSGLKVVCVYGGVPKYEQRKALETADIVVATPGRLNDLIQEGSADLSRVSYVVLDEADRMLDKGFEEEIRKIINITLPLGQRQTLMFTATWPESVRSLAATFMSSPVKIAIGDNPTGDLRANTRITQRVEVMDPRGKEFRLIQLLKQYQSGAKKDDRILVFCLYKKEATRVEQYIRSKGFRVAGIHGDLSQEQRTRSLEAFKSGGTPILVATDVAARGLDIPNVMLVLNNSFSLTVDDYIHRIGRTGRAGKDGLAITFFTEHDKALSGSLINVLKAAKQEVPAELLKFGTTVKRKEHDAYGAFTRDVDMTKTATKIRFD